MSDGVTETRRAEDIRQTWGRRIADKRRDLRLTQMDLALRSDKNVQTVSRAERGERRVSLDTYEALASALGVDLVAQ